MIERIRTKALWAVIVLALLVIPLAVLVSPWWWLLEILFVPLVLLGIYDYFQSGTASCATTRWPVGCASCSRGWGRSCTSTSWRTTPTVDPSTGTPAR